MGTAGSPYALISRFLRFALVGIFGTAAHYTVLVSLVEVYGVPVLFATTAGFLTGALVNYILNRRFTFVVRCDTYDSSAEVLDSVRPGCRHQLAGRCVVIGARECPLCCHPALRDWSRAHLEFHGELQVDVSHVDDIRNTTHAIRLIINADDFGYFDQVCRGIVDVAERGIVTATGVMANGPALERWLDKLKGVPHLSIGVHLNATLGCPLTSEMSDALTSSNGRFPSLGALVSSLVLGRIPVSSLLREWRAQIERCLQAGLKLSFINSHEHIHMFPALYGEVRQLADEFGIANVRAPRSEWSPLASPGAWVRSGILAVLRGLVPSSVNEPILIGVAPSGRLDLKYCSWRLRRLVRGATYELMCHPGWRDNAADNEPKLRAYHDWEGELRTLTSPEFARILQQNDIGLTSFGDLERPARAV